MPRSRRRRRRSSAELAGAPAADRASIAAPTIQPSEQRGRRLPSAAVVLALCLGIWLGTVAEAVGGLPGSIALWFGVIGAGLAGGRILRRWLQHRRVDR